MKNLFQLFNSYIGYFVYSFFLFLDKKTGSYNDYQGEDAPYCGHAYSGHSGRFTSGSYREGDGGEYTEICKWLFLAGYENIEFSSTDIRCYFINFFPIRYQVKRFFKSITFGMNKESFSISYSNNKVYHNKSIRLIIFNFKTWNIKSRIY